MAGASPAGNLTSNLPQSTIIHYDKQFRENLKAETPFLAVAEKLELPVNSGNQYTFFQYSTLAADTSQASQGTVGTSESVAVVSTNATIGEYADYLNFSSLSLATAIDPLVENCSKELAYQLGESLSALMRATADGAHSVDASVQIQLPATSTSSFTALSLSQIRNAVQSLAGRSVKPFFQESGNMGGVIHPFALGDVLSDNSNDSPIDILKHTDAGLDRLSDIGIGNQKDTVTLPSSGVEFYQSNLVTQTANYKGVTGLTALRTYIVGSDGLFRVNLSAVNDTNYADGRYQDIMCKTYQNVGASAFDPTSMIPAWTAYRVHFTSALSPDSTQRIRTIDAASAVS